MDIASITPFLFKFFRFAVVGATGLVIDFGITYFCKEKLQLNKYIANGIGFFAAATSNFFINRSWTFANVDPDVGGQYVKFILFALIGLLINSIIVWWLNDRMKRNFYLSKVIATAIVTLWNFLSNFFFTFR
jgi:putative flippase GtrA